MGEYSVLPNAVQEWAGMNYEDGRISFACNVIDMNDAEERSFEYIAQVIRKEYKQL
jgi:hypothetical protein